MCLFYLSYKTFLFIKVIIRNKCSGKQRCGQRQPYHSESCGFSFARGGAVIVALLCLFIHISMAVMSVKNIPSHAKKSQWTWGKVWVQKITFYPLVDFVRPGIPEVERGDGVPVGFKWGKGQNIWFERCCNTERYVVTEEQCVLLVTGQAYRGADCSAGSVQEDKGRHGSYTGWVP